MNVYKNILLLLVLLFITIGFTQAQINDFELWTGVKLSKKINDKLSISFEEEFRFNENATSIKKFHSDIGVSYKLHSKIKLGVYYRFIQKQKINHNYSSRHRYYINLTISENIQRLKISIRNRFQTKYTDLYSDDMGMVPNNYLREKLAFEYNIRKNPVTPYISGEIYYQLNGINSHQFNKYRITAGVKRKINNNSSIGLYYRQQNQFNVENPAHSYILGISYSYKF